MENFQTEEQQVEAIKNFWQENGNSIIAGLVIGLGGFIGFNYYQDAKLDSEILASEQFIELQESAVAAPDAYTAKAESYIADNSETSYASLTALALAKEAVSKSDWEAAQTHLQTAIDKAADKGIAAIATLRLARVQIQAEQVDKALTTLSADFPASFKASVEETKGDAYLINGDKDKARAAYQAAVDHDGIALNPNLQMKLDDLAEVITLTK